MCKQALVPVRRSARQRNQDRRQSVFEVIGVMEPLGNFFGQSRDNSIFIPITTFEKYYPDRPTFPKSSSSSSCVRVRALT